MLLVPVLEIVLAAELVELLLVGAFSRQYFSFGPRLLVLTAEAPEGVGLEQLGEAVRRIPYFATRIQGPGALLIRRRATSLPFDVPALASPRITLTHGEEGTGGVVRLEVRHSLLSMLLGMLLLVPVCAGLGLVAGPQYPYASVLILVVLWSAGAAGIRAALVGSARRDARRVWEEATGRLGIGEC